MCDFSDPWRTEMTKRSPTKTCVSPNSEAAGAVELRRPQHDEQRSLVLLELGPLMGAERVLDGEIVQPELFLHLAKDLPAARTGRSRRTDRSAPALADIGQSGQIGDPPPVGIRRAIDDALVDVVSGSRAGRILN